MIWSGLFAFSLVTPELYEHNLIPHAGSCLCERRSTCQRHVPSLRKRHFSLGRVILCTRMHMKMIRLSIRLAPLANAFDIDHWFVALV